MIKTHQLSKGQYTLAQFQRKIKFFEECTGIVLTWMQASTIIIASILFAASIILPSMGENLEGWSAAFFLAAIFTCKDTMSNIIKQLK
jgi:hypothetical protein